MVTGFRHRRRIPPAGAVEDLGDADQAGAAVPSTDEDDLVADDGGRPRGAAASEGRIRYPVTPVQPVDLVRGDGADIAALLASGGGPVVEICCT
jgi:hypothetical protein